MSFLYSQLAQTNFVNSSEYDDQIEKYDRRSNMNSNNEILHDKIFTPRGEEYIESRHIFSSPPNNIIFETKKLTPQGE